MTTYDSGNYLTPKDVSPEVAVRVLTALNDSDSPGEIADAVNIYAGDTVISVGVVQKILNIKANAGKITDLYEIATVPRIGAKKFTAIVNALSE